MKDKTNLIAIILLIVTIIVIIVSFITKGNKNADEERISIVNNNDSDYKKLVKKIKEKKDKENILKNRHSINDFNDINEQKLQLINNEILLNSNKEKKIKKIMKDNVLSISKK